MFNVQDDHVIWSLLGPSNRHCTYKKPIQGGGDTFCRNKYNITGICSQESCPLANGLYATVLQEEGLLYINLKTPERARFPVKLWEKIQLSTNREKALEQLTEKLRSLNFPEFQIQNNIERIHKITQMNARARRIATSDKAKVLLPVKKKVLRRENARAKKALKAANVTKQINAELLDRLRTGTYNTVYELAVDGSSVRVKDFNSEQIQWTSDVEEESESEREFEDEEETETSSKIPHFALSYELESESDEENMEEHMEIAQ